MSKPVPVSSSDLHQCLSSKHCGCSANLWQPNSQLVAQISWQPHQINADAHKTLSKPQHTRKTDSYGKSNNKPDRHGGDRTGRVTVVQACRQKCSCVLPAEETWHSVPSKAGYRTLLSLQLLQTPLTSYHQHSKEKSSEKSHRFDRFCFLIRASGDTEQEESAGGRAGERNMGKSAGQREGVEV